VSRVQRRDDRGAVTAELAMALPVLVAVVVGLVWLLAVGAAQVRVVDAAREGARTLARGDPQAEVVGRVAQVAGGGAESSVDQAGGQVTVSVRRWVTGPGGLFGFLPGVEVHAIAVATLEEGP
jgi:Flp pilus assembly protein TadG